jgi:hypothetical protein
MAHSPAMIALAEMGDLSVPFLFDYINDPSTSVICQRQAVRALVVIKGHSYAAFVDANKKSVSKRVLMALYDDSMQ